MEFLSQAGRRVADRWRGATPTVRLLIVIMAVAIGGGFFMASQWSSRDNDYLFGGSELSLRDLTTMEAAFGKARLTGAQIEGRRVRVPHSQKDLYLKALHDYDALPAQFFSHSERLLAADNPFLTQKQQEAKRKLAKEREVALILGKINGIEEASVQYEETETTSFPRTRQRRATVAIRASEGRSLDDSKLQAIRQTVRNAIGVASWDDVTVLDLNAGVAFTGEQTAPTVVDPLPVRDDSTDRRSLEESYERKIRERLAMYPGVVVGVNVELDAKDPAARHATASIGIPHSALRHAGHRQTAEISSTRPVVVGSLAWRRSEEEVRKSVEAAVMPLLPSAGNGSIPAVSVELFADSNTSTAASMMDRHIAATWLNDHWPTLLGTLLVVGLMLRLGHALRTDHPMSAPRAVEPHFDSTSLLDGTIPSHRPLTSPRGELHEELAHVVQSDPHTAADTVRHWLAPR